MITITHTAPPEVRANVDATIGILTTAGFTQREAMQLMLKANVRGCAWADVPGDFNHRAMVTRDGHYEVHIEECIHPGIFATGPVRDDEGALMTEHCPNCNRFIPRTHL